MPMGWSPVRPVISWAFPQSLLHFCPCTSCRQGKFWIDFLIPPLGVLPDYRRGPLQALHPPVLGVSTIVTSIDSLEFPPSQVSGMSEMYTTLTHTSISLHSLVYLHPYPQISLHLTPLLLCTPLPSSSLLLSGSGIYFISFSE